MENDQVLRAHGFQRLDNFGFETSTRRIKNACTIVPVAQSGAKNFGH
jgi:hypothetical protein